MADKRLISVPLTDVRTNDEEVIGALYPHKGKVYRWVKNGGSTALQAKAACLSLPTAATDMTFSKVVAPSGANVAVPGSGAVLGAAGMPVTAIGPSGSDTGDHGWVQCKGIAVISALQSETAADQYVGSIILATDQSDAAWGVPVTPTSATSPLGVAKKCVIARALTTVTGASTAASYVVDIQCL